MAFKVLPAIPFLKNTQYVFILHAPVEVTAPASLFAPKSGDQKYDRLGKLLALLGKDPHAYDDLDHAMSACIWLANSRKEVKMLGSYFDDEGLEE